MHIPDGILPGSIAIAGYAAAGGVTWYSLRQIKRDRHPQENIPKASLLTAAFLLPLGFIFLFHLLAFI